MIQSVTRIGATTLLTAVLLSSAAPASATLKLCQKVINGDGRGPTIEIAMQKAIFSWRMHAQDAYGSYYDNYRLSENKGRTCHPQRGTGLIACQIWANPCKSTKPSSPSMRHN